MPRSLTSLVLALGPAAVLAGCSKPATVDPAAEPQHGVSSRAPTPSATAIDVVTAVTPSASPTSVAVPASFRAIGTEPFWSARVEGGTLTWSTPEQPDGVAVPISREDDAEKATVSGRIDGHPLELEVRRATCSDGMSDTVYPLSVIRRIGSDVQQGCAR